MVDCASDARPRQDRVGEAVRREHRDLDVQVGVDQVRAHVPALQIDDLARLEVSEPDDAVAAQRDGRVHDLVREHVDDPAVAEQHVGLDAAAGGPDERAELVHSAAE
jgi:hypothetical protein